MNFKTNFLTYLRVYMVIIGNNKQFYNCNFLPFLKRWQTFPSIFACYHHWSSHMSNDLVKLHTFLDLHWLQDHNRITFTTATCLHIFVIHFSLKICGKPNNQSYEADLWKSDKLLFLKPRWVKVSNSKQSRIKSTEQWRNHWEGPAPYLGREQSWGLFKTSE